ncbi:protein of unknown function [Methylorubrum extorquens]|uniref:Uncharacterized protein n=1 Tax=Methylorubrum extorquens TaxID=408 RepID=A0A2N9AYG9_METEX|nr:protein of unknown function [Methylorubrum extorquens]
MLPQAAKGIHAQPIVCKYSMATPDDDRDGRLSGPVRTPVNGATDQAPARPVGQRRRNVRSTSAARRNRPDCR